MAKKYLLATIQKIESPSFYGFPLKGKDSMIILAGFFLNIFGWLWTAVCGMERTIKCFIAFKFWWEIF